RADAKPPELDGGKPVFGEKGDARVGGEVEIRGVRHMSVGIHRPPPGEKRLGVARAVGNHCRNASIMSYRAIMLTTDTTRTLARLFSELVDGANDPGGAFMLNSGDVGLLRSLDRLPPAAA